MQIYSASDLNQNNDKHKACPIPCCKFNNITMVSQSDNFWQVHSKSVSWDIMKNYVQIWYVLGH